MQFHSANQLTARRATIAVVAAALFGLVGLVGCHGPLGDWMSRTSLTGSGVPAQSEPDIDFEMAEPERTADLDEE